MQSKLVQETLSQQVIYMTGKMKEKLIQCHNERPDREIISFTKSDDGYIADKPVACILCGKPVDKLRDQLSIQEFVISGMCQACQDATFGTS